MQKKGDIQKACCHGGQSLPMTSAHIDLYIMKQRHVMVLDVLANMKSKFIPFTPLMHVPGFYYE